jgi:hypothetical protein
VTDFTDPDTMLKWLADPNWGMPREGATADPSDPDNWALACHLCELQFPMEITMSVVADHYERHAGEDATVQLRLMWIGLGEPPKSHPKLPR